MASDVRAMKKEEGSPPVNSEKVEFVSRLLSTILFVPLIALMCLVPYGIFCLLSFATYAVVLKEIYSRSLKGKYFLRNIAAVVCLAGICAFIYCRKVLGLSGCIFLICVCSFTDIGAYGFGKIIGGPKLCPKISPKKTWAGFFGGIIMANLACYAFERLFFSVSGAEVAFNNIYNLATIQYVIIFSIFGDLLESFFKRKMAVKDMGAVFPGHGGFLDRLDSLIVASIALALVVILL
ncbi:hypothetical protein FACS189449_06730 [Alphaproteobacteria bacterium]|nr:hypothetical protein FACS189449_06730 [Alphaproteobacteria bacterium]